MKGKSLLRVIPKKKKKRYLQLRELVLMSQGKDLLMWAKGIRDSFIKVVSYSEY